jgi:branched-chain amino acid transport system permease protein
VRRGAVLLAGFGAILASGPLLLDGYLLSLLALAFAFAFFGAAWNLMMGFAGMLSLGHGLYIGLGGYAVAVGLVAFGISPWIGLPLAGLLCAAAGAAIAWTGFRFAVRGVYFALLTLAVAEMARILFEHWDFVGATGGFFLPALGPSNMPLLSLRGGPEFFYLAFLVLLLAGLAVTLAVRHSRMGYRLMAIREDEDAARAAGVPVLLMRIAAAALSGGMTGIGGGMFALMNGSLFPGTMMGVAMSIEIMIAPIIGGLGSVAGPAIGALFVMPVHEASEHMAQAIGVFGLNTLIYGLLVLGVVVFLPAGIGPSALRLLRGRQ